MLDPITAILAIGTLLMLALVGLIAVDVLSARPVAPVLTGPPLEPHPVDTCGDHRQAGLIVAAEPFDPRDVDVLLAVRPPDPEAFIVGEISLHEIGPHLVVARCLGRDVIGYYWYFEALHSFDGGDASRVLSFEF